MRHPAKFSEPILEALFTSNLDQIGEGARILDPFAGTGRVHRLTEERGNPNHPAPTWETWGVELEPEWAELHPRTLVADACHLPFPDRSFDAIVTSPCYGNRMADQTLDSRGWYRNTYRMALGRPAHDASATSLQWGARYRELHRLAWLDVTRVARPGAMFLLNVKDHQRAKRPAGVSAYHLGVLGRLGWAWVGAHQVEATGYTQGENSEARFEFEWIQELRLMGE